MAKNFAKSCMVSEDVRAKKYTGVFYEGTDLAEIHDGALVVEGALEPHAVYTGMLDLNTRKITAPAADTASVDVVDYVGVSNGDIAGNNYREGIKTYGLVAPAGAKVRVRRLGVDDTFFTSADNFASAPTVGQYAVPTAGSTLWTPASSASTTKTCIRIEEASPVTEGVVNTDTQYFCTVVNVM